MATRQNVLSRYAPGLSRRSVLAGAGCLAGLRPLAGWQAGKSERLRVTRFELFKVVVPMQPDIINSPEFGADALTEFPSIPKFILKLHTDSGIVGIGETDRGTPEAAVRRSAEFLVGKNLLDMDLTRLALPGRGGYSGFEMACYDAVGKAIGWPVYRLLGGLAQRRVLVNYWCGRKTPADMRRVAERAVKGRFQGIKVKGRRGDPIVKAVEAIAAVSPKLRVTVDFNSSYQDAVEEFQPIADGFDAIGNLEAIEDPFAKTDLGNTGALKRRLKRSPVALHLGSPVEMLRAIKADACSVFNTVSGTLAGFVANAFLAGAARMPVWHGSSHDLGLTDAAMLHSCAAAANCTMASDILSFQRVDDLIVVPIDIRDSYATVPDRPGLGVVLDEDAVRRYEVKA